jgi:hypothetical protein
MPVAGSMAALRCGSAIMGQVMWCDIAGDLMIGMNRLRHLVS